MNILAIIIAAAVVGGIGIILGVFLGVFEEKFHVEIDENEGKVRKELPGNNCGGCGYSGCDALAKAIASGSASVDACPVGGEKTAEKISTIMGVSSHNSLKKVAFVKCAGDCDASQERYIYDGIEDCRQLVHLPNQGMKACQYGCTGLGTCVKSCPFDAIHIVDGIAVVDKEACKACGKCIAVCPKKLIELVPYQADYLVQCNSKDPGRDVMKNCDAGCIGCGICEKSCEYDAVHVKDFLATVDTEKCMKCGTCAQKCPKGIITGRIIKKSE